MLISSINPHSTREKTSISHAFERGYTITPDGDGNAEVLTPKGDAYLIHNWQCDCLDALGRNGGSYDLPDGRKVCKHVLWLSQLHPCACGSSMVLNTDSSWKAFVCIVCGSLTAFQLVKAQRRQAYRLAEQEADIIKTHQPADVDTILEKATKASHAIFSDEPAPKPKFTSQHGIYITQDGDIWEVYCVGFVDSTHNTEPKARNRAERLEVLEASHANKRTRSNIA
jgi:hypothetical protein